MTSLEKQVKVIEVKRIGLKSQIQQINKAHESKRRFTLGITDVDFEDDCNYKDQQGLRQIARLASFNQQDGAHYYVEHSKIARQSTFRINNLQIENRSFN